MLETSSGFFKNLLRKFCSSGTDETRRRTALYAEDFVYIRQLDAIQWIVRLFACGLTCPQLLLTDVPSTTPKNIYILIYIENVF